MIFTPACKTREKYAKMLTLVAHLIGRILRFFSPCLYIWFVSPHFYHFISFYNKQTSQNEQRCYPIFNIFDYITASPYDYIN